MGVGSTLQQTSSYDCRTCSAPSSRSLLRSCDRRVAERRSGSSLDNRSMAVLPGMALVLRANALAPNCVVRALTLVVEC